MPESIKHGEYHCIFLCTAAKAYQFISFTHSGLSQWSVHKLNDVLLSKFINNYSHSVVGFQVSGAPRQEMADYGDIQFAE